jgi:anti-sigma-K factor RskA/putative zinc finger protein
MRLRRTDPHTLAGAYALDALNEADRERFEHHLGVCEACRAEAASLRGAAGWLAEATAAVPPARLRGQVLAEAARTRQQPPPVRVAERARRSWHGAGWSAAPRLAVAIAGFGILVALALGTLLINDQHRLHMDETQRGQIAAILNAPDADIMTVRARTHGSATVVMSHAAHALVLTTARLPALPPTECYQVWLMGPHRMRSAGKLPLPKAGMTAPMIVAGLAAGDRMGVTVEPAAGAPRPSSQPVLMLALPAD